MRNEGMRTVYFKLKCIEEKCIGIACCKPKYMNMIYCKLKCMIRICSELKCMINECIKMTCYKLKYMRMICYKNLCFKKEYSELPVQSPWKSCFESFASLGLRIEMQNKQEEEDKHFSGSFSDFIWQNSTQKEAN